MVSKLCLVLLLLVLAIVSLIVGVADLSMTNFDSVFFISRLPRLISIVLTGAGMSLAGLIMQQLSQNKFAAPSTSGTIESASLGILVSLICFGSSGMLVKICIAFIFAMAGAFFFTMMLERIVYKDALFIPLFGIMFGKVISALTTFLAYKYDLLQSLSSWLYGDFSGVLKGRYELLYLGIPLLILSYVYADKFTIAGFGESFANSLGLDYHQVRFIGLTIVAMLTAVVVLTVGEIAFIGLVIPNIVALLKGDNVRKNLPYTVLIGASFVLACDIIGRIVLYPYEISVSLIIGVFGSCIFLFILMRRKIYA